MARPITYGLSYFPINTNDDDKLELFIAENGAEGYGILIILWKLIYRDNGYYITYNDDLIYLLRQKTLSTIEKIQQTIQSALKRGLFDQNLYDNYNILTSRGIQKRYFELIKRKKISDIKTEYLLININDYSCIDKKIIAAKTGVIAAKTGVIAAKTGVIAAKTGVSATNTNVIAAETGVIAAKTGVIAAKTGVIAAKTGVFAAETGVFADNNAIKRKEKKRKEKYTKEKKIKENKNILYNHINYTCNDTTPNVTIAYTNNNTLYDEFEKALNTNATEIETYRLLWIKNFAHNPALPELNFVKELVDKFGKEKADKILHTLRINNFHSIAKMKSVINEDGSLQLNGANKQQYTWDELLNLTINMGAEERKKYLSRYKKHTNGLYVLKNQFDDTS